MADANVRVAGVAGGAEIFEFGDQSVAVGREAHADLDRLAFIGHDAVDRLPFLKQADLGRHGNRDVGLRGRNVRNVQTVVDGADLDRVLALRAGSPDIAPIGRAMGGLPCSAVVKGNLNQGDCPVVRRRIAVVVGRCSRNEDGLKRKAGCRQGVDRGRCCDSVGAGGCAHEAVRG